MTQCVLRRQPCRSPGEGEVQETTGSLERSRIRAGALPPSDTLKGEDKRQIVSAGDHREFVRRCSVGLAPTCRKPSSKRVSSQPIDEGPSDLFPGKESRARSRIGGCSLRLHYDISVRIRRPVINSGRIRTRW